MRKVNLDLVPGGEGRCMGGLALGTSRLKSLELGDKLTLDYVCVCACLCVCVRFHSYACTYECFGNETGRYLG